MWPYFILLFIICFCSLTEKSTFKSGHINNSKSVYRKFVHFLLALFSGLRYNVGVDYGNYVSIFNWDVGYSVNEPGFEFLITLIDKLGGTYQMMFLIMAIVTQVFVFKTFNRLNKGFWLATIVYYCFSTFYLASFNGSRQYVAIAISIWALKYIYNKQFIKYIISILSAAFCFHMTALLFIPLYFYLQFEYSKKVIVLQIIGVVIGAKFLDIIISYTPYLLYMERESEVQAHGTVYIFALISLFISFTSNHFKLLKRDIILKNMNLLCLYTILLVLLQRSGILIQMLLRVNSYFLFSYLTILPIIIYSLKHKSRILARSIVILSAFAYLVKTIVFSGTHYSLVPYQMNFQLFKFL